MHSGPGAAVPPAPPRPAAPLPARHPCPRCRRSRRRRRCRPTGDADAPPRPPLPPRPNRPSPPRRHCRRCPRRRPRRRSRHRCPQPPRCRRLPRRRRPHPRRCRRRPQRRRPHPQRRRSFPRSPSHAGSRGARSFQPSRSHRLRRRRQWFRWDASRTPDHAQQQGQRRQGGSSDVHAPIVTKRRHRHVLQRRLRCRGAPPEAQVVDVARRFSKPDRHSRCPSLRTACRRRGSIPRSSSVPGSRRSRSLRTRPESSRSDCGFRPASRS